MTKIKNPENLRQYRLRFSLVIEPILAFVSSTNLVRERKNVPPNFERIACSALQKDLIWIDNFILLENFHHFCQKKCSNSLCIVKKANLYL